MAQQDIAVLDGTTFMVSDAAGDVLPGSGHGFFHADTRFLSGFTVLLNGHRLHPLSSGNLDQRSATFYTTNETTPGLAPHTLTLIRERSLNGGLHERLVLVNYGQQVADVTLTVDLAADFADIFQARSGSVRKAGTIEVEGGPEAVRFTYRRRHFVRQAVVYFDPLPHVSGSRATYALQLAPQESRTLDVHVLPVLGDTCPPQPWGASLERPDATSPPNASGIRSMEGSCPDLSTSDLGLALAYRRAVSDLVALRLRINDEQELPAAGLPWYMAIFGRDSIITALETLLLGPGLAVGTLRTLAAYQGRQVDPFRDEEPGKIPHEIREGELSSLEELPHTRYYGTVDATPLWLVLLSETHRWTGDLELVRELLPAAEAALAWIDHYGDLDGDGFVEYLGRSPRGLTHQGWKDSADPVRFADGTLAEPPIALCEVQGYVYDAKLRMAELYEALGHRRRARELRQAAAALRRRFHEAFWLPDHQYIALALDGHKRPVDAIASNAGHCLWSGILEPEAAAAVARRLLSPELFSGWGIRTLSS
ncbi:MAG TPA: glycogen debranching N-terminal domain-containing protein, partial [Chloroflexota bacterium]